MKFSALPFVLAGLIFTSGLAAHPPVPGKLPFGNPSSVVRKNDLSGVEQLEAWKVGAEQIADTGNASARADYQRLKGMIDLWINRKKLEVSAAAASSLSTKADLSRGSISAPMEESWNKLQSENGTRGPGVVAALGIAKGINQLIVKGKAKQAELVNEQLDGLRLKAWPAAQ